jgi:hypothetical protein
MLDNSFIYNAIINKKQEDNIFIATISTLDPLTAKLSPDDVAIPIVRTTDLTDLAVDSRIILLKIMSTFVAIAIIGTPVVQPAPIQLYRCTANQNLTTANMANINGMVFTIPANSGYWEINTNINVRNETSATPDVKFDWDVTGTEYSVIVGRNCRGGPYVATNTTTLDLCRNSAGHAFTTDVYYPLPAVNGNSFISEYSIVLAGDEDTIFQFRGSQVSADAENPTTVSGYSHIILTKLNLGA